MGEITSFRLNEMLFQIARLFEDMFAAAADHVIDH